MYFMKCTALKITTECIIFSLDFWK